MLFVRGGAGTAGADAGGINDGHLSDIFGHQGMGFDSLSALLVSNGFEVTQIEEGAGSKPADLTTQTLRQYAVVVFGSNNARYDDAATKVVDDYVRGGGGVLFFSDLNYGSKDGQAADSDQALLTRFGIVVSRDNGLTTTYRQGDAGDWTHPLLAGVDAVSGGGETSFRIDKPVDGVLLDKVLVTKDAVKDNTPTATARPPTADDFAVLAGATGKGRIVCTFDRDTFFNGEVGKAGNRQYTLNVFRWLARG